jgi:outer membrane immunogenic protein
MKHSKLTVAAAVAVSAMLGFGAASAADLPVKSLRMVAAPASSWTGFYIGGNAGYGWSDGPITLSNGDPDFFGPAIFPDRAIPAKLNTNPRGFIGGAQAGYNFQSGQWVYGVETDIQYANINGTGSLTTDLGAAPLFYPVLATTQQEKLDWFGTLRARLGFTPTPQLLAYVTGGLAYGHASASTNVTIPPPDPSCPLLNGFCSAGSAAKTMAGWTVGAGAEYAIARNWTVKAEYLYYNLGRQDYRLQSLNDPTQGATSTAEFSGNIVRLGVNYRFGPSPVVAKY